MFLHHEEKKKKKKREKKEKKYIMTIAARTFTKPASQGSLLPAEVPMEYIISKISHLTGKTQRPKEDLWINFKMFIKFTQLSGTGHDAVPGRVPQHSPCKGLERRRGGTRSTLSWPSARSTVWPPTRKVKYYYFKIFCWILGSLGTAEALRSLL